LDLNNLNPISFQQKTLENERLEPEKISSLKRKQLIFQPNLHSMIFHPSVGIFTSKELDIAIPMCSRNRTWRAYSTSKLPGEVSFSQGWEMWAKSREIFMETTKGDTDLWDKNSQKTIQVDISIGYMCAQKRRKRKGKFFAVQN